MMNDDIFSRFMRFFDNSTVKNPKVFQCQYALHFAGRDDCMIHN